MESLGPALKRALNETIRFILDPRPRLQEKGVVPHGLVTGAIPEAKLREFQDNPGYLNRVGNWKEIWWEYGVVRVRSLELYRL